MSLVSFLETLKNKEIKLRLDDQGNIRVVGQRDKLDQALLDELKEKKSAIIEWLKREEIVLRTPILALARDTDRLPTSFAQQQLWFIDQLNGGSMHYNIPAALLVRGRFDEGIAEQALVRIIQRHESLRTVFLNGEDGPLQWIQPSFDFQPMRIDLSALARDAQEKAVSEAMNGDALKPFNLSADLMLRASFVRLSGDEGVLLFNVHHIASDGWSMGILVNEFCQLYEAFSRGEPDPLPPLAIQYADYVEWHRGWLESEVLELQFSYWETQLANLPRVHGVPLDRPRSAVQTFNGARYTLEVDPDTIDGLKQVALSSRTTLFMVLHGVFALLLSRYSSSNDIVIGTPVANRLQKELEPLVGFFVNTLVLRVDCSPGRSFQDYLVHIKSVNQDAQANQDVPFEHLVERLNPHRSTSHTPLFQIMFSMDTNEATETHLTGLTLTPLRGDRMAVKFDITLDAMEDAGGLRLSFAYNRDLFDASTLARMGEHLKSLLRGVVANPEEKIHALPMLTETEQHYLLYELNETAADFQRDTCLHELFEAQVERSPDSVAVVFEDTLLSYRQLNAQANRLAHYLRGREVGPDTLVGICVERSLAMMVGILGILKAGGAYVPLEPSYPRERLDYMIADSAPTVLLTQASVLDRLSLTQVPILLLDLDFEMLGDFPTDNPRRDEVGLTAGHLAYVIYTSGSTGEPKGVMNAHTGVVNPMLWAQDEYGLGSDDRILQKTTFSFDVSVWEFFLPLLSGAQLVIARPGGHLDPRYLAEIIERERITIVHFVPSMLQAFLDHGVTDGCQRVRHLLCSGEELPYALQLRCEASLPIVELHNLYGPTEAAVHVTSWLCRSGVYEGIVPIGRPLSNTRVYVLDGGMKLVPQGVVGELYLGGEGLARCYYGRADLTSERFVPDGYSGREGERLYRTGDLVRYRAHGELEFIGRVDRQVKIRGYRIEPGEVEAAVGSHDCVSEVVVVVSEDEAGDKKLLAYFVAEGPAPVDAVGLRNFAREKLPDYMVPSAFIKLEAFPLNGNGKVDRRALPAPDLSKSIVDKEPGEALTPVGELLAGIWEGVLNVRWIGSDENFFDLGGHSLLATRVLSQIREIFGVEIGVRTLFERPTLAGLTEVIEQARRFKTDPKMPPIERISRNADLPLSFAQQRLWFFDQLMPDSSFYNMPSAIRLSGQLNIAAFEQAFTMIIARHEVLRTVFAGTHGRPVQRIIPFAAVSLSIIDLEGLPEPVRERELPRLIGEEASYPFKLSQSLPIRVKLLRFGDENFLALLTMHHIAGDGWSIAILIQEIASLYKSFLSGEPDPLGDPPIQYADFACWQRRYLQGEALENGLAYWKKQLAGISDNLILPTDRPKPLVRSYRGAYESFVLPAGFTDSLKELSRRNGVTFFMVLLAAFQVLLNRYTNQEEIVVGSAIAGRNRVEVEKLIGYFVNMLVLRTDLSGDPTFNQLLTRVREIMLEAYAHQDIPFDVLVEHLQPARATGQTPFFQVAFGLHNVPRQELLLPGLRLNPLPIDHQTVRYDLTVWMSERPDGLTALWAYSTELFERSTIIRMHQHYQSLLASIIADPSARISILEMASEEEVRHKAIEQRNLEEVRTRVPLRRGKAISVAEASPIREETQGETRQ
jgi:amino acid adenylation domain-containing protein